MDRVLTCSVWSWNKLSYQRRLLCWFCVQHLCNLCSTKGFKDQNPFELNASWTPSSNALVGKSNAARTHAARNLLIGKRPKFNRTTKKNKDGWQVVAEYESDKLVSGSLDAKRG